MTTALFGIEREVLRLAKNVAETIRSSKETTAIFEELADDGYEVVNQASVIQNLNDKIELRREQASESEDTSSGALFQTGLTTIPPIAKAPKFELITVAEDKDGKEHRVLGVDGNPNLTVKPEGIEGVKPLLPVRLQEETSRGSHIRKHLTQLIKGAGYSSIEQAIWDVSRNWTVLSKGTKPNCLRLIRKLPHLESKSGKSIIQIELQEEAGIYRVGSVFFREREIKDEDILFDRQTRDRGHLSQVEPTTGLESAPTSLKTEQSSSVPEIVSEANGGINPVSVLEQDPGAANRGAYSPSQNLIRLTDNADLSTFAHEMSHWYLTNLFDLVRAGATSALSGDVQTILNDWGIDSLASWETISLEEQRTFQERCAYQTEIYLATGEAPSNKLRKVSQNLGCWIREVTVLESVVLHTKM